MKIQIPVSNEPMYQSGSPEAVGLDMTLDVKRKKLMRKQEGILTGISKRPRLALSLISIQLGNKWLTLRQSAFTIQLINTKI